MTLVPESEGPHDPSSPRSGSSATSLRFTPTHSAGRRHARFSSIVFWQLLLVCLLAPQLLASSGGLVAAHQEAFRARSDQSHNAALTAAMESYQGHTNAAGQEQQQVFFASDDGEPAGQDNATASADLTTASINSDLLTTSLNATVPDPLSVEELAVERWGTSAAYMAKAKVILFAGGQIASADVDGAPLVTNDVFVLDLSNATMANGGLTSNSTTWSDAQRWKRISSQNLPPHAFAARAVTHSGGHHDGERLFVVGGATPDCSPDTAPVHVWQTGQDHAWEVGRWTSPALASNQTVPPRRRGATAVQVPNSIGMAKEEARQAQEVDGTSFLVLGGYVDYTTCNSSVATNLAQPVEYTGVDIWTMTNGSTADIADTVQDHGRASMGRSESTISVRTLPLDTSMPNMSYIDYATVVLPANRTAQTNASVLFLGGRDVYGDFVPMNLIWSLDVDTGIWSRMQTTNGTASGLDIPVGRIGHSSTLLDDGTILLYGGYVTLAADQMASNETYILDPRTTPAVWYRVAANGGAAPQRAFHAAVLADGVFVVGFGQQQRSNSTANGEASVLDAWNGRRSIDDSNESSNAPAYYIDTKATNDWQWTTDLSALLAQRAGITLPSNTATAEASAASATPSDSASSMSASSSQSDASTTVDSSSSASSATSSSVKKVTSSAPASSTAPTTSPLVAQQAKAGAPATAANHDGNAGTSDGSGSGEETASKQRNTAVIVSVVGAFAVAASVVGYYLVRKRKASGNDNDSLGPDEKYERFDSNASANGNAPPVSSLWINQPMSWANTAGRGIKRHASMAARSLSFRNGRPRGATVAQNQGGNNSPTPSDATFTAHNLGRAGRWDAGQGHDGMQEQYEDADGEMDDVYLGQEGEGRLPEHFIHTLLDDDDAQAQQDIRRTVGGAHRLKRSASVARSSASMTSSATGGASHFSYPYLTAMHRASTGDLSSAYHSQGQSPVPSQEGGETGVLARSPRDALLRASLSRSPGSTPRYYMSATAAAMMARGGGGSVLSSAVNSPAWDARPFGKNGRLGERVQEGNPFASPAPLVQFDNPFADPAMHRDTVDYDEQDRANTELDLNTTVLGGETGTQRSPYVLSLPTTDEADGSPSLSQALFPWSQADATTPRMPEQPSAMATRPMSVMQTPRRTGHGGLDSPSAAMRIPFFQQPTTGVRLPIHPVLLNAAMQRTQGHDDGNGQRRTRASMLRVTNENS